MCPSGNVWCAGPEGFGVRLNSICYHCQQRIREELVGLQNWAGQVTLLLGLPEDASAGAVRDVLSATQQRVASLEEQVRAMATELARLRKKCGPEEMIESDYLDWAPPKNLEDDDDGGP